MNNRATTVVLLVLAHGLMGCGGRSAPSVVTTTGPTLTSTPKPPDLSSLRLSGSVYDTGFRPIAGAALEVLDGPQAGMALTSDADGRFSYTGSFAGLVTMRATKAGYATATETVRIYSAGAYVYFDLVSLVPAIDVAGNYLLTIAADPSCTMLPDQVRTRNYDVAVRPANSPAPITGFFDGFATSGVFAPNASEIRIGVSGNYVGISTNGEGPMLVEQVGDNRYVAYSIDAGATNVTTGAPTISAPFTGMIEYCELQGPIGSYYDCSTSYQRREQCTAGNGRLTLTRR